MEKIENNKNKKGFVILMVILLLSVILVVGLGVFDIIVREILISNIGRESQKAFYAADAGAECVQYWEKQGGKFIPGSAYLIDCNGNSIVGQMSGDLASPENSNNYNIPIKVNFTNGACASVTLLINSSDPSIDTVITSRGYNVGCDDASSKKVERGVRVKY